MLSRGIGKVLLDGAEQGFKELRDTIIRSSHFYVFPLVMQGCVNITENGLKPEALYLNDYTHVSKVISGDMPLVATWEKSTRWIGKPKRYPFMQCEMGARKVTKLKRAVGRYIYKGWSVMSAIGFVMLKREKRAEKVVELNSKLREIRGLFLDGVVDIIGTNYY